MRLLFSASAARFAFEEFLSVVEQMSFVKRQHHMHTLVRNAKVKGPDCCELKRYYVAQR